MPMAYSEAHRIFLSYIRALKVIPNDQLLQAFRTLCAHSDLETGDDVQASLMAFITEINLELERHSFKISSVKDQSTESTVFVFVNTKLDEAIQGCTNYTPPELDCIKQLIDNIVYAHEFEFSLPYTNAKQQIMGVLKNKGSEAEFFMKRLVDDGWIELSSQKKVRVSAATLAELKDYMVDRFGIFSEVDYSGKLLECTVCKELVIIGKKCGNSECPKAFHSKCYTLFTRHNELCPKSECERPLTDTRSVGVQ